MIKARIAEKVSKATTNKMLSALRGVLAKARTLRMISAEDYDDIKTIKGFNVKSELRGRALHEDKLISLALVCWTDSTAAGLRDAALMAVGYGASVVRQKSVCSAFSTTSSSCPTLVPVAQSAD